MKLVIRLLGVLFIITGLVWILQGANILPGSFMTGQLIWLIAGVISVIIGAGLIIWTARGTGLPG